MSYLPSDFTAEMTLLTLQWAKYSPMAAELNAIVDALGSDLTTHDCTIETPPAALRIGASQTSFTNDALLVVNKGKAGGLSNASMASIINAIASGGAPTFPPFPTGATAIYSMRRTSSGYAGKCVNLRRTSDNTASDIGFDASGAVDVAAAAAFAAGSLLYVAKWYDQSGNTLDVSQAAPGQQPQFLAINGKGWLSFGHINDAGAVSQQLNTAGPVGLTGDQTIGAVQYLGSGLSVMPIQCFDAAHGWFLILNGLGSSGEVGPNPGVMTYWSETGAGADDTHNLFSGASVHRLALTRASGALQMYVDGNAGASATGKGNTAASTPMGVGGLGANYPFEGLMSEVFLYSSALTGAQLAAIDASESAYFADPGFYAPFNGTAAVQFGYGQTIALGNVMAYERTQARTVFAAIQAYNANPNGQLIYTNVTADAHFVGHEFWIDLNGFLRFHLHGDFAASNILAVRTTVNVVDGQKHFVAAAYDGSSTAAGVKIYIDGAPQPTVTVTDALTLSTIASGQDFQIGNQQGSVLLNFRGTIGFFQMDTIAQSAAYIAAHADFAHLPANDPVNTACRLAFTEGDGITVHDTSAIGNNFVGLLSNATMWVPR